MSQVNWKAAVNGGFTTGGNWDTGTAPVPGDDVAINTPGGYIVSLTASVTVGSITIADGSADLSIANPGGTDSVTGNFTNAGRVDVDSDSGGGATLSVTGTLTNSSQLFFGNGGLTSPVTVTLGAFDNTGAMTLNGNAQGAAAGTATMRIGTGG